ncbi:MAG: hypothetical protein WC378_00560 [Opitutaceae bacterium]|jgi:hypothetical protein
MQNTLMQIVVLNRRVWLFGLCATLALVLGFFTFSGVVAIDIVSRAGFWVELTSFVLFLCALWRTFSSDLKVFDWRSIDWRTVALVGACGTILLVHEAPGFKILMDEVMLLGTSMSMHFDKLAVVPMRGNDIQGTFNLLEGILDKRPLFFPFLLSLVHDATGYRPENAFALNGILTFVFLSLTALWGRLMAGRPGSWLAVLLFTGLPLLGQNALGGGFELLNLTMALATLLLGSRFILRRDDASMAAFCLSALLLCQTRYESGLIAAPAALVVLWVWMQEKKVILPWPVILAPLLLVLVPLQHRVFDVRISAWEMASRPGYEKPFSLSYVLENLSHTVAFFFARPTDQPSSLVFSALGWFAVPFGLLLLSRQLRALRSLSATQVATVFFMLGFIAQFVLMMVYFWGKFDDPVIRRLSLPTHLWLLGSILLVLPQFFASQRPRWALVAVAALGVLSLGIPAMASRAYDQEYLPGRETAWRRQFMGEQARKDYLVIDNDCVLWVTHQVSSTPVIRAKEKIDDLSACMRNHVFSSIYVFQRFDIDVETGKMTLRDGDDLGPEFVLETVREERLQSLKLSRLSRVIEIRKGEKVVRPGNVQIGAPAPRDPKELERLRNEYLRNFLKQLP